MSPHVIALLYFFPVGYALTVALELPVLWIGLPRGFTNRQRLDAGWWLTACTYPVVAIALPILMSGCSRTVYLVVAESFAVSAECGLLLCILPSGRQALHGCVAVALANAVSCGVGGVIVEWFGWF